MPYSFLKVNKKANTMLIVDDDELNCDILANIFDTEHEIVTAGNGAEGLEALERHEGQICAILLDVMMPVMDGMEMLSHLAQSDLPHEVPVFLITGETDSNVIKRAYDLGVMDVIPKPITPHIVLRRVHSVMELFAARNHFADVVKQQTEELREQNKRLADLSMGMIEALATATEFRSSESGEHVVRIHDITHLFLTESPLREKYSDEDIEQISLASILHDVGKIAIPDSILNKPGRFTDEEFEIMKQHTAHGEKMLTQITKIRNLPFYEHARAIARWHHERWDGRGYPDGLKGDEIPMTAQIVSIADVYDALVSPRVYKAAFGHEVACKMIRDGKCGTFNPLLQQYFDDISDKIEALYIKKGLTPTVEENGYGEERKTAKAGINVDGALGRFMGNEKLLDKYLGRFLTEKSYAALVAAIESNDEAGGQAAVHTLKSVCGTIGCEGMQAQVVEQEKAMRAGDWAGAVAMMPAITATYNTICEALKD